MNCVLRVIHGKNSRSFPFWNSWNVLLDADIFKVLNGKLFTAWIIYLCFWWIKDTFSKKFDWKRKDSSIKATNFIQFSNFFWMEDDFNICWWICIDLQLFRIKSVICRAFKFYEAISCWKILNLHDFLYLFLKRTLTECKKWWSNSQFRNDRYSFYLQIQMLLFMIQKSSKSIYPLFLEVACSIFTKYIITKQL